MPNSELFRLEKFSFTYPGASTPCLHAIDLVIRPGDFVLLTGCSGSGKTTLLRQLKPELAAQGQRTGAIFYRGKALASLTLQESADIGFVGQDPELQLVTDKVWHELAFGLENLGLPSAEIRRRVAEMSSFFGIGGWFHADTASLSGGQKQMLALASVVAMQPRILLLDEPCSQLDPVAREDFLSLLTKLNRELGISVLLIEHRPDSLLPMADRVLLLEQGHLAEDAPPRRFAAALIRSKHSLAAAMPAAAAVAAAFTAPEQDDQLPVTVREGRLWLAGRLPAAECTGRRPTPHQVADDRKKKDCSPALLSLKHIDYRYPNAAADVLRGLDLDILPNDLLAICGANGSGKSTLLKLIAGVRRPDRGKRIMDKQVKIRLLPQHPRLLFTTECCQDELAEMLPTLSPQEQAARISAVCARCEVPDAILTRHPYDISGGEQQRLALAKLLLTEPQLLLLDEPTKGLDAACKARFATLLADLRASGMAIVMATHDIEFAACYLSRAALLFDGTIISQGDAGEFFTRNSFYTTAANRMAREWFPAVATVADLLAALREVGQR